MGTSVALAIAATSAANAAAEAEASAAKDAACRVLVNGYQHAGSTVEQMQEYASCIERLHPAMTSGDIIFVKIAIVAAMIGGCIGLLVAWKDQEDFFGVAKWLVYPFFGAGIPAIAALTLHLVWSGIVFLFSA